MNFISNKRLEDYEWRIKIFEAKISSINRPLRERIIDVLKRKNHTSKIRELRGEGPQEEGEKKKIEKRPGGLREVSKVGSDSSSNFKRYVPDKKSA